MFFSNIKERARDRNMGEPSRGWKKETKGVLWESPDCCDGWARPQPHRF